MMTKYQYAMLSIKCRKHSVELEIRFRNVVIAIVEISKISNKIIGLTNILRIRATFLGHEFMSTKRDQRISL